MTKIPDCIPRLQSPFRLKVRAANYADARARAMPREHKHVETVRLLEEPFAARLARERCASLADRIKRLREKAERDGPESIWQELLAETLANNPEHA